MSKGRVQPGQVLGDKYRVERILGVGGMGVVVCARHLELGQRVALKLMHREALEDPTHAERFLREARASVQLKSIHAARVLDVGKLPDGEPFIVMEYLDGKDLDEVLRQQGALPPHVACDFILQASEALAEAHGVGLVHRDVKLKNIFLTSTVDGRPLVKVLDFGLAKQTGIGGDVSLTATSTVFGSPQYMSPEQMRSARDVDVRSDVWSLGVCLYELVTGRLPFEASGLAEICAMVLKDPVPAPSSFVVGLPADLEAAILRCLEKDPSRRFQSVAELAFALQGYAADEGSAQRILQVMESSRKLEVPTLVVAPSSSPSTEPSDDHDVRTIAAFSTRSPTSGGGRPSRWVIGAFTALVALGLIGTYLTALAWRARSSDGAGSSAATALAPTAATAAIAEVTAEPPPEANALEPGPAATAEPTAEAKAKAPAPTSSPARRHTVAPPRRSPPRTKPNEPKAPVVKTSPRDPGDRL